MNCNLRENRDSVQLVHLKWIIFKLEWHSVGRIPPPRPNSLQAKKHLIPLFKIQKHTKRETRGTKGDMGNFKEDGNTTNFMDITPTPTN